MYRTSSSGPVPVNSLLSMAVAVLVRMLSPRSMTECLGLHCPHPVTSMLPLDAAGAGMPGAAPLSWRSPAAPVSSGRPAAFGSRDRTLIGEAEMGRFVLTVRWRLAALAVATAVAGHAASIPGPDGGGTPRRAAETAMVAGVR